MPGRVAAVRILLLAAAGACSSAPTDPPNPPPGGGNQQPAATLDSLATARGRFIGTAVDRLFRLPESAGGQYMTILGREFNALVLENDMKHERLRPSQGVFRFARADSIVSYAESKDMYLRGHTLVWHRQIAPWMANGAWTVQEARDLLEDHITTVVAHYKGRVAAWDVVNEAIGDDASMRASFWSASVGADYIEMAFRWAHDADSTALLFYNDYNIEGLNAKSDATYALVSGLLADSVPIHGIGFQAHFVAGGLPSRDQMMANFARFAALGLKIHITELDIRVPTPATAQALAQQATDYGVIVDVCLDTPACEGIWLWGFTDGDSWIPGTFPGFGQALIYDASYNAKPSYFSIRNALRP